MDRKSLLSILMFLIAMLLSTLVYSNTVEVCASCSIKTIRQAVNYSTPFDTIQIQSGLYFEQELIIDKPITIIGEKGVVIDGQLKGNVILVNADSVTIKGLKIINVGASFTQDYAAIRLHKTNRCKIINNEFDAVFFGIVVEKSKYTTIRDNLVQSNAKDEYNSGNGIHLWYCQHILIDGNQVNNLRDGIYLEFVDSSKITNNISIANLRYGLHFMFSNYNEYSSNVFKNNGAGVAVMFSKFIKMYKNTFTENWGVAAYGLLLKEINDAEIWNNVFEENTVGIKVEGTNRINYFKNEFIRNGWAVKIQGGCYENIFKTNNFQFNTFDIAYDGKINNNEFNQNYWSNYTGYDLDKDNFGDIPYRPVKLFSYVVNRTPETIILLRSLFIDLINISEKVSPLFTPDNLIDNQPLMKAYRDRN